MKCADCEVEEGTIPVKTPAGIKLYCADCARWLPKCIRCDAKFDQQWPLTECLECHQTRTWLKTVEKADILDMPMDTLFENPADICRFLRMDFNSFPIKTEFVVTQPQYVIPLMGRSYLTSWYEYEGGIVNYEFLQLTKDFRGTGMFKQILLEEVWENGGMDGHIEMFLQGWILTTGKEMN